MTEEEIQQIEKTYCENAPKKHYNGCHLVNHKCAIVFLINEIKKLKKENEELKKTII
jgi:hypothetical protein